MIRSIPNPPMNHEDVARFRLNLAKHLRNDYSPEELRSLAARRAKSKANANKIIANCGGKNPLLTH